MTPLIKHVEPPKRKVLRGDDIANFLRALSKKNAGKHTETAPVKNRPTNYSIKHKRGLQIEHVSALDTSQYRAEEILAGREEDNLEANQRGLVKIDLGNIYREIGDSKLNAELQQRFGARDINRLLFRLNPKILSPVLQERISAQHHAIGVLRDNARAIWSVIWYTRSAELEPIFNAIKVHKKVLAKFESEEELDRVIFELSQKTKLPGWLILEKQANDLLSLHSNILRCLKAPEALCALAPSIEETAQHIRKTYGHLIKEDAENKKSLEAIRKLKQRKE
ncbi:MAG: hypothetical protein NTY48_05240 [Candidatus Diapherotrites archaeon]|nr:hypothetical protein [Candidatus Diapherotrites archaeon]